MAFTGPCFSHFITQGRFAEETCFSLTWGKFGSLFVSSLTSVSSLYHSECTISIFWWCSALTDPYVFSYYTPFFFKICFLLSSPSIGLFTKHRSMMYLIHRNSDNLKKSWYTCTRTEYLLLHLNSTFHVVWKFWQVSFLFIY